MADSKALIRGLPDEVVSAHVLTRVPWYERPSKALVCKAWKEAFHGMSDGKQVEFVGSDIFTNQINGMICLGERKLPPLSLYPHKPLILAANGCITVWVADDTRSARKIDLSKGFPRWEATNLPTTSNVISICDVYKAINTGHKHKVMPPQYWEDISSIITPFME